MATLTLDTLIANAENAIPHLGSRAQKAAELVEHHEALFLGNLPSGSDHWEVGPYRVSIKAKSCDCKDMRAPDHDVHGHYVGKMCKHRIAAMFIRRLEEANGRTLADILAESAAAGGGVLKVEVIYTGKGIADAWAVVGHHADGKPWEKLDQKLKIQEQDLINALEATGLRITKRMKHTGMNYHWWVGPATPEDQIPAIRVGNLRAPDISERRQINDRMMDMMKADHFRQKAEAVLAESGRFTEDDDGMLWA